jgi:membrane protein YqaA with SNARE-associated domain
MMNNSKFHETQVPELVNDHKNKIAKTSNLLKVSLAVVIFVLSIILARTSGNYMKFASIGYFGIFLGTFLGSSTIFFPAPNIPIILAGSILYKPMLVGIIGGFGWGCGEITGYIVGRTGASAIKTKDRYKKAEHYVSKYGAISVFLLALVPNQIFDFIGIASGVLRLPIRKFLISCILGRTVSAVIIAYLGHLLIIYFKLTA